MVCNVDYLTIEAWIRQRLNCQGRAIRGRPRPEALPGRRLQVPARPTSRSARKWPCCNEALENTDASVCYLHPQTKLIDIPGEAGDQVEAYLQRVLDQGGEGVVIRNPRPFGRPSGTAASSSTSPSQDAEARVVGFTSGRETAKGSRLLGKIGALIVDYQGKRLELSGLTDAEREFAESRHGPRLGHRASPGRTARLLSKASSSRWARPSRSSTAN